MKTIVIDISIKEYHSEGGVINAMPRPLLTRTISGETYQEARTKLAELLGKADALQVLKPGDDGLNEAGRHYMGPDRRKP